jgi:hypothetical protein
MSKQARLLLPLLILFAILIHVFAADGALVEKYYSNGIYPYISKALKYSLGWLPVSVGDILYGLGAGWLLFKVIRTLIQIFKRQYSWPLFGKTLLRIVMTGLVIYILFNCLWGLNYNRKGIADQLSISVTKYSKEELIVIDSLLLEKANQCKEALLIKKAPKYSTREIFDHAEIAYKNLGKQYPFFIYKPASIKSSAWGWLGNYLGFTGYYNPFTGEAQVNTTVPVFLQPFTTCHEIAHQFGYAKENEANFVGYLAAASSTDTAFQYSVYLDLFLYSQRNLYNTDSLKAKYFYKKIHPGIQADLIEWRKFNQQHRSPLEPMFSWLYGKYLKNNEQPSGVLSYDEVTGFLIAYNKKFGRL